jgi:hypothetical protein
MTLTVIQKLEAEFQRNHRLKKKKFCRTRNNKSNSSSNKHIKNQNPEASQQRKAQETKAQNDI